MLLPFSKPTSQIQPSLAPSAAPSSWRADDSFKNIELELQRSIARFRRIVARSPVTALVVLEIADTVLTAFGA